MLERLSLTTPDPAQAQDHSQPAAAWQFRRVDDRNRNAVPADTFQATADWLPAQVPGCIHRDLQRNDLIPDPFFGRNEQALKWIDELAWEYRLEFPVDQNFLDRHEHLELVCDGLDTLATVTLNDTQLGRTDNQFRAWRWDAKPHLQPGRNVLVIRFEPVWDYIAQNRWKSLDTEVLGNKWGNAVIRKSPSNFGWDWGPSLVTCGIWQPLRIEGWSTDRLTEVTVTQDIDLEQMAVIDLEVSTWRTDHWFLQDDAEETEAEIRARVYRDGRLIAEDEGEPQVCLEDFELWWPAGMGEQPLYDLVIELLDPQGEVLDRQERRIGFRHLKLRQERDRHGISFQFEINGVPIFAKGANWIPAHQFPAGLTRAEYQPLIEAARDANMNMLRVWGGGIYEHEAFYDLCDEMGILVWQDFMFACALYPGTEDFVANVRHEADQQVQRLHHRACIATWCGNNEIEMIFHKALDEDPLRLADYRRLFDAKDGVLQSLLPPGIPYVSSSPFSDSRTQKTAHDGASGDTHFWAVWHARHPVKDYEKHETRFCSEFGMQSYPHIELARRFCPEGELNVFSPAFENHQKNGGGNGTMLHYIIQRYRFPRDHEALTYLSQVNQAYCIKTGIEAFRRGMPRTMGALYWQLNDVWPVSSWSSLDFGGHWKALHYAARRFFAPALISPEISGDVVIDKINVPHNSIRQIIPTIIYDGLEPTKATVTWTLYHVEGEQLAQGQLFADLTHNQVTRLQPLIFDEEVCRHGAENLVGRLHLHTDNGFQSANTIYLTLPRLMNLPGNDVIADVSEFPNRPHQFLIKLTTGTFQPETHLTLPGRLDHHFSDNYFDLHPAVAREITLTFPEPGPENPPTLEQIRTQLRVTSLTDAYAQ